MGREILKSTGLARRTPYAGPVHSTAQQRIAILQLHRLWTMLTKPIVKSLRFSIGGANRGDCVVETVPAMKPEDAIHEQRAYFFGNKFSFSIEEMYCQEIILDGAKSVVLNMILACFLFNGFLFSDYFITGIDFKTYCVFRLLFETPVAICIIYHTNKRDKYYQALISTFPLIASTSQSILIFLGHGNYRLSYLYGLIIVCICSFVITRPRVPYAIASVLSQFAIYLVTLHLADCDADVSRLVGTLYGLSGCAVTLMAAYALERISRRAFLLNLRVRLLNQKLERMAMTDPLTGLANRRRLDEATQRFWSVPSSSTMASLILIDVDRFKVFNDSYGHAAGDLCLTTIAKCVAAGLRDTILRSDLVVKRSWFSCPARISSRHDRLPSPSGWRSSMPRSRTPPSRLTLWSRPASASRRRRPPHQHRRNSFIWPIWRCMRRNRRAATKCGHL